MQPFEHYRRQTERIIRSMLEPDERFGLNSLAAPQHRHEGTYGQAGREYQAKALQALAIVTGTDPDPERWQEVSRMLTNCVNHAIVASHTGIMRHQCLAPEGSAASANIAALRALAWLNGFHARQPPGTAGRPEAPETRLPRWFSGRPTGLGSRTIDLATSGIQADGHDNTHDHADFNRCLQLRAAVTETEAGLHRLRDTCSKCAAIWDHWGQLAESAD